MIRTMLLILALFFGIQSAYAQLAFQDLRILVVVSKRADDTGGANSLFNDLRDTVSEKFSDAGLPAPDFVLYAQNPELNEILLSKDALIAAGHLPAYTQARDSAAADLTIFVVSSLLASGTNACGAAEGSPVSTIDLIADLTTGKHLLYSNIKFVGYVAAYQPQCATVPFEILAAHEIGHLLYAEHEVVYENGEAIGEVASNGDLLKPFKQNHPAVAGLERTIMYSTGPSFGGELYSKQNALFSNLDDAFGEYEDVAKIMSDTSHQYVAHYRIPKPPLQACNIDWEFQFCQGGNIVVAVTALLPGYEILNMDYDVSFGGGPWEDLLEGTRICPALIPQFATIARAILETPVGFSECTVTVPIPTCPSNGPPWP